jgi:hypothetical protein
MTCPGDGGELDTRSVAWSGGRAAVTEPCDRAVVGRKRARVCPIDRALRGQVACIEVGGTAENASVDAERAA